MLTLIRSGEVYDPQPLGRTDLLLAGGHVVALDHDISLSGLSGVEIIDATDLLVVPGLVDGHVHVLGGGGEGGFHTRTPPLHVTDATTAGVTTVVGLRGTDGTTRTMPDLLAACRGLQAEGITCYAMTGSYEIPVRTLTGSITDDLVLVDAIIGVGEVAIADHRGTQPSVEELARVASAARLGGLFARKGGTVVMHVGDGEDGIGILERVVESTEVRPSQFLPTHMNRNPQLFASAKRWVQRGGRVDLTTSTTPQFLAEGEVKCATAVRRLLDEGVPLSAITLSSDGQGSLPAFDAEGRYAGLQVGSLSTLHHEVRCIVRDEHLSLEQALTVATQNPAEALGLHGKGRLTPGADADVLLLRPDDLSIDTVIARGRTMVRNGEVVAEPTFTR